MPNGMARPASPAVQRGEGHPQKVGELFLSEAQGLADSAHSPADIGCVMTRRVGFRCLRPFHWDREAREVYKAQAADRASDRSE